MRLRQAIQVHPGEKMSAHRGKRMALAARWVGLTLASVAPCAHAAGVVFNNVADTTTTAPGHASFTSFDLSPSLSGNNVMFRGSYSGGQGIYTGSVGAGGAAKVVDTTDTAPGHGAFTGFGGSPSVSGSNLTFWGSYSGGFGIYTGSVGTAGAAKVVDTTDSVPGSGAFTNFSSAHSVSGSNIGFLGLHAFGEGIYTASVGATGATKFVDQGDTAPGHGAFLSFDGAVAVSGSNVAISAAYSGGSGIYTGSVGATGVAKIVDTSDTAPGHGAFTSFGATPSISGSNLAFRGSYSGGHGIYTGTVGVAGAAKVVEIGDIAPGHGAFNAFSSTPSVSGSNVAFGGNYSGGGGIYLASGGAGGSLSAVVNSGDALFGSTVTSLSLGRFGYDNNAIAFQYTLADGRSGTAVANLPEPASFSLLSMAALPLLRRRPRGRR